MRPEVSLIVVCGSVPHQARSFLAHLTEREPCERIELVLVSRAEQDYRDAVGRRFAAVQRVAFGAHETLNEARARAVDRAAAPIVVFLEDHVRFEEPFVDVVLELFAAEEAPAAVGWVVGPGRRRPVVSLAGWLVEYAAWGPATPPGPCASLPGHNCAYRRSALQRHRAELSSLLRAENVLHQRLVEAGEPLVLTPRIRMRHHQFLSLRPFVVAGFWYGWNFADARQRAGRWGVARRVAQVLGAPAVPAMRWIRLARVIRRERVAAAEALRCVPAATLNFVAATTGETLAHLFGAPGAVQLRLTHVEVDFDRGVV